MVYAGDECCRIIVLDRLFRLNARLGEECHRASSLNRKEDVARRASAAPICLEGEEAARRCPVICDRDDSRVRWEGESCIHSWKDGDSYNSGACRDGRGATGRRCGAGFVRTRCRWWLPPRNRGRCGAGGRARSGRGAAAAHGAAPAGADPLGPRLRVRREDSTAAAGVVRHLHDGGHGGGGTRSIPHALRERGAAVPVLAGTAVAADSAPGGLPVVPVVGPVPRRLVPRGVRRREGMGDGASDVFEARDVLVEGAPAPLAAEELEAAGLRRLVAGEPGGVGVGVGVVVPARRHRVPSKAPATHGSGLGGRRSSPKLKQFILIFLYNIPFIK